MPGAWELRTSNEVFVAVLTRETVTATWARAFREIILPTGNGIAFLSGMPFDHARNRAVQEVLERGFQYLWFIDDDVIVPPNAYEVLRSNNLDIVSGLYFRRNEPIVPVAQVRHPTLRSIWLTRWNYGEIIPVYYVGSGCLLIKRRVLEIMPPPWFEWLCDREDLDRSERTSEDFTFCRKLVDEYGITPHVDTRVQCSHCGFSRITVDGKSAPLVAG